MGAERYQELSGLPENFLAAGKALIERLGTREEHAFRIGANEFLHTVEPDESGPEFAASICVGMPVEPKPYVEVIYQNRRVRPPKYLQSHHTIALHKDGSLSYQYTEKVGDIVIYESEEKYYHDQDQLPNRLKDLTRRIVLALGEVTWEDEVDIENHKPIDRGSD